MTKRHNKHLSGLDWLIITAFVVAIIAGVMAFRGYRWEKANTPQEGDLKPNICYQWQETHLVTITGHACQNWNPSEKETWLLDPGPYETLQYSSCRSSFLPKDLELKTGTLFVLDAGCRGKVEGNILTLY